MDLVTTHFDVLVLGAGPGGYVAAIRAAQLGKTVAVVEENYWGGVCLNVGCIPSKALLKNAELAHVLTHDKAKYGIEGDATMSFGPTHARSRKVSEGIVKGVHFLMKKNKITEIDGWGTLTGPTSIDVKGKDGGTTSYTCDDLIIATGAKVRLLPGLELSENVVTYEEQILDSDLPSSMIIGGSGAIGVEFAYVMKNFGVDVTIVEFLDRIVPTEDADVSKELAKHYKKLGVKIMTSTKVEKVEDTGSGVKVTVSPADGGESQVLEADKFLAAFGFAPRLDGYGLEAAGVAVSDRGAIEIDEFCRTNVEHVYAIGDVTGKLMLAHVAEHGPMRASTVADLFSIDKGAISRQVTHLIELGLIEKSRDPEDGRAWLLTATPDARERLAQVAESRRRYLADRLDDWESGDLETFTALLARYNESLGSGVETD